MAAVPRNVTIVELSVLKAGALLWQPPKGSTVLTVVCKATYKLEPGNANHELCAGIPGIVEYLAALDEHHYSQPGAGMRAKLARSFELIAAHEAALAERLRGFLRTRRGVRILGPQVDDPSLRVPTIAFYLEGRKASEIPPLLDARKLAIRWGHFYAVRAIAALGLTEADGIIRVSMVHYNSIAEVDRHPLAAARFARLPGQVELRVIANGKAA